MAFDYLIRSIVPDLHIRASSSGRILTFENRLRSIALLQNFIDSPKHERASKVLLWNRTHSFQLQL
jgi:hypothetical protein